MSSVNISIKEEAYDFLKSRKTPTKSFSDVILDFKPKKDILQFAGCLKHVDWDEREKIMRDFRKNFLKRPK
ncbi:MAG: antitoxin VapB family protein [Candidatus Woesearchaeota archaeon]|jgi:predicted CopG family antitoxin|nr:antitoxin VapB family protein [Candidatus Woesearchaeota archaeon]MDP7324088.1 antitoxin VapB family protein [Candidatus Woesearchaeota archaeon]MDP7457997.1 antitoxin VapB family protein [Candidatus Woesearchaeota archaeon]|tara:strand:- start:112 stop:324 length:213 start_codon:yes stop_codon:yes gene_type:complete